MARRGSTHTQVSAKQAGLLEVWRYGVVLLVFLLAFGVLGWRLVDLHVVDRAFLRHQGEARTVRTEAIEAHRGMITDRRGEPLAVSAPVRTLWINPGMVRPDDPRLSELAGLLEVPESGLRERIREAGGRQFLFLARKVRPGLADRALALQIPGLASRREFRRFYPAGEVAAHVVGVTDIDGRGQEGIELAYNEWLRGAPGAKKVLKDNRGRTIKDLSLVREAQAGQDLQLTLDLRLQYLAYRELKAAVQAHSARSGSALILDARTGEVLAMVNQPSYNPNDRTQRDPASMRNRALTDLFEPGSTIKPLTIAAALRSGRYTPETMINTAPGYLRLNGHTIRDHRNYGRLSVSEVIAKSSNVGASRIAIELGGDTVRALLQQLGLGQATGIGFPGEAVGTLPAHPSWKKIEEATLSYGYGLNINSLQLAQAYLTLASGGLKRPVILVKGQVSGQPSRVLSEKVARQVRRMLAAVVARGTGTRADPGLYRAGGKTGTVHLVGREGYRKDAYKAIFAGMAPIDNPRLVCVVAIDSPQGNAYYGGEVAAPVFASIMADAMRLLNIRPDLDRQMADQENKGMGGRG